MKQISGNSVNCCPTGCPYLGKNGCRVACGNEGIECPVMAGILDGENAAEEKKNAEWRKITMQVR